MKLLRKYLISIILLGYILLGGDILIACPQKISDFLYRTLNEYSFITTIISSKNIPDEVKRYFSDPFVLKKVLSNPQVIIFNDPNLKWTPEQRRVADNNFRDLLLRYISDIALGRLDVPKVNFRGRRLERKDIMLTLFSVFRDKGQSSEYRKKAYKTFEYIYTQLNKTTGNKAEDNTRKHLLQSMKKSLEQYSIKPEAWESSIPALIFMNSDFKVVAEKLGNILAMKNDQLKINTLEILTYPALSYKKRFSSLIQERVIDFLSDKNSNVCQAARNFLVLTKYKEDFRISKWLTPNALHKLLALIESRKTSKETLILAIDILGENFKKRFPAEHLEDEYVIFYRGMATLLRHEEVAVRTAVVKALFAIKTKDPQTQMMLVDMAIYEPEKELSEFAFRAIGYGNTYPAVNIKSQWINDESVKYYIALKIKDIIQNKLAHKYSSLLYLSSILNSSPPRSLASFYELAISYNELQNLKVPSQYENYVKMTNTILLSLIKTQKKFSEPVDADISKPSYEEIDLELMKIYSDIHIDDKTKAAIIQNTAILSSPESIMNLIKNKDTHTLRRHLPFLKRNQIKDLLDYKDADVILSSALTSNNFALREQILTLLLKTPVSLLVFDKHETIIAILKNTVLEEQEDVSILARKIMKNILLYNSTNRSKSLPLDNNEIYIKTIVEISKMSSSSSIIKSAVFLSQHIMASIESRRNYKSLPCAEYINKYSTD